MFDGKEIFALFNSCMNGISAILLCGAYIAIKRRNVQVHVGLMISGLCTSAIFLCSYLLSKYLYGTHYVNDRHNWRSIVYFVVLIPHLIMAIAMLPMIFLTVWRAAHRRFDLHKKIARPTFWIWLYVSVSGVVIYFLMYHFLKPAGLI